MHPAPLPQPQPAVVERQPGQGAGLFGTDGVQHFGGQAQRGQAGVALLLVSVKAQLDNAAGVPRLAAWQAVVQLAQAVGVARQQ